MLRIGTRVKYFPIISNKEIFTEHAVRSESWDLCGETVVKISDKNGGISIRHLEIIDTDEATPLKDHPLADEIREKLESGEIVAS